MVSTVRGAVASLSSVAVPTQPSPAGDKVFKYEYDQVGNRKKMINPWSVAHTYDYDHNNRLTYLSHPSYGTHTFQYDWLGNRTRLNYANGTRAEYTYNDRQWLETLYNRYGSGGVISSHIYKFDYVGNRKQVDDDGGFYTQYDYDNLYQLKRQTKYSSGGTKAYEYLYNYDEVGNRTWMQKYQGGVTTTTDYTYDNNNKLDYEVTGGVTTDYGYDANGNTTSRGILGQTPTTYTYDFENRLTNIAYPDGNTASFQYDGDGLRVRAAETGAGAADHYLYDGMRVYARLHNYVTPRAIYVAEGDSYYSPIVTLRYNNANATLRSGCSAEGGSSLRSTSWTYHRDGMENVRRITTDGQYVAHVCFYEAFGNVTSEWHDPNYPIANPYRYVGALGYYSHKQEPLLHVGARYYSPQVGRFWQRDPVKHVMNRYAYGASNPVNAVDPTGLVERGLVLC